MDNAEYHGWRKLLEGYPWFSKPGLFPLPAYSEFMPSPRLGRRPYGEVDLSLFSPDDDYGWNISEIEEEYELQPGLANLAHQIVDQIVELGQGKPAHRINGHQGRNLVDNPYWPPELAAAAGKLLHEKYVTLLPLALSRTQDDKGRIRWTFFGGSEQGPERAIWESFYFAPGIERSSADTLPFWFRLLSTVCGESCRDLQDLHRLGFRIFETPLNPGFPFWQKSPLPSFLRPFIWAEPAPLDGMRYLLTFTPFSLLPEPIRHLYLSGQLALLPFPGSLVFWGMPNYLRMQSELPTALQVSLQRLVARHGGPEGIRVPQSGWFHEPGRNLKPSEVHQRLLLNTYKRTSRWDRAERYENEVNLSSIEDTVAKMLFSTELDTLGLYGKPIARNSQIWNSASQLVLNGPEAGRAELERAAESVADGGTFRYRFQFPAMKAGPFQVYWQRPLAAFWSAEKAEVQLLDGAPYGYLTAYDSGKINLDSPVDLWPRLQKRDKYLLALRSFDHLKEHYRHQTALNVLRILDLARRWGSKPLPRSLARQALRITEHETLESWLAALPQKSDKKEDGAKLQHELERLLESERVASASASLSEIPVSSGLPQSLTFAYTANRTFEESWWNDILLLSKGKYPNKNNADCIEDPPTLAQLAHRHRDLETLGDYLLNRHRQAIVDSGVEGKAACGEMRFSWDTDFDFAAFGGWKNDQEGHTHERNLVVIIPGRNRNEAVIMADHYDTAYMEDIYLKSRGGSGARLAAAGADDNCSATATLLQGAPIFLRLAKEGLLEKDVWLVHLTGEEFPSDCLGARNLCQALIEGTFQVHLREGEQMDLSNVNVAGVYVLDMIGHDCKNDLASFQISPGRGRSSLELASQAHLANAAWNASVEKWNLTAERHGKGRGRPSPDGVEVPIIAKYPALQGEIRLTDDPHSSLYNTDGQIFSDCGIPVVLFMENYDINRSGYHDNLDSMANIDLDYGAALAAISIEAVARAATGS